MLNSSTDAGLLRFLSQFLGISLDLGWLPLVIFSKKSVCIKFKAYIYWPYSSYSRLSSYLFSLIKTLLCTITLHHNVGERSKSKNDSNSHY